MQVNWGRNKESHFRASAVFRDMYLHNESTGNNTSLFGWGVQASGNIKVAGPLQLFFNGVYGEGITLTSKIYRASDWIYTQSSQSEGVFRLIDVRLAGGCANRPRSEQTRHFGPVIP